MSLSQTENHFLIQFFWLALPWDLQRMDSTFSFDQVLSRGQIQDHIIFVPKTEENYMINAEP